MLHVSNQIKSLLLSHHHSTSALVSEILMSVLQTVQRNNRQFTYGQTVQKNNKQFTYGQTVQKNNKQFTYGQTVQKNNKQFTYGQTVQKKLHWSIYSAPDSAKKNNSNLHMDRQCKKNNSNLHMDRQCKKQQQFTYGQYIFTDCTEDNVQKKKKKKKHICITYMKKTKNKTYIAYGKSPHSRSTQVELGSWRVSEVFSTAIVSTS